MPNIIELEVEGKFPGREFASQMLCVKEGTTVGEVLSLLNLDDFCREIIVVFDGGSVILADRLDHSGKVIILPVICGG